MSKVDVSEFGKEVGLIHEALVVGRKVGAGQLFWKKIASDPNKFREIMEFFYTYEVKVDRAIISGNEELSRLVKFCESNQKSKKQENIGIQNIALTLVYFDVSTIDRTHLKPFFQTLNAFLKARSYRQANIIELACFAIQYPDAVFEDAVVAAGSAIVSPFAHGSWKCQVPYLNEDRSTAYEEPIKLWQGNFWFGGFKWFAAIREK